LALDRLLLPLADASHTAAGNYPPSTVVTVTAVPFAGHQLDLRLANGGLTVSRHEEYARPCPLQTP